MRPLSPAALLGLWEDAQELPSVRRGLALLAAAAPDTPVDGLARLSLGERDARLAAWRAELFGRELRGLADCPACGECLEFRLDTADLWPDPNGRPAGPPPSFTLARDGYKVDFRLPNSLDLERLDLQLDPAVAESRLLEGCLLAAERNGRGVAVAELPATVVSAIDARMAEADPQAETELALACPTCAHQWRAPIDILSFFWAEIHALAVHLLREVHVLASAYGWREGDILALSAKRRRAYLEFLEA